MKAMGNISNKERKLVQLYLTKELWEQVKLASDSVDEPITTWIRRAIYGSIRNWSKPTVKRENWPKCSYCGKHHDETEHERL